MEYKTTKKITEDKIKEVLRIKEEKGLTAENLLSEAKKKKSPLHDLFEWDDTEAANNWRLQQARVFINEIKIIIDTKQYYAFENVSITIDEEPQREYKSMVEITNNKGLREQVLKSAYSQLIYWKNKYETYKFEQFDTIIQEIDSISKKFNMEA